METSCCSNIQSGSTHSTGNYKPISILPAVAKVMEKLVAEQIICRLNSSSFTLHAVQFGFRASAEAAHCFSAERVKSLLDESVNHS